MSPFVSGWIYDCAIVQFSTSNRGGEMGSKDLANNEHPHQVLLAAQPLLKSSKTISLVIPPYIICTSVLHLRVLTSLSQLGTCTSLPSTLGLQTCQLVTYVNSPLKMMSILIYFIYVFTCSSHTFSLNQPSPSLPVSLRQSATTNFANHLPKG